MNCFAHSHNPLAKIITHKYALLALQRFLVSFSSLFLASLISPFSLGSFIAAAGSGFQRKKPQNFNKPTVCYMCSSKQQTETVSNLVPLKSQFPQQFSHRFSGGHRILLPHKIQYAILFSDTRSHEDMGEVSPEGFPPEILF